MPEAMRVEVLNGQRRVRAGAFALGRVASASAIALALLAAGALIPFVTSDVYLTGVVTQAAIYACLALGLNVVVGMGGLMDLGYAAFAAVGAYSWAILSTRYHLGVGTALPLVLLFALAGGMVVALPTLRLRRDYLAIVTLAFGLMVQQIATNLQITGGAEGIIDIPPVDLAGLRLSTPRSIYLGVLVTLVVFLTASAWLRRSRLGLRLRALRADEEVAEAVAVNTYRHKSYAYLIGAVMAAIVGMQYASYLTAISPPAFDINLSIYALVAIILGGPQSSIGAALGGAFVAIVPELLRSYVLWGQLAFGVILVVMIIVRPAGLIGIRRALSPRSTFQLPRPRRGRRRGKSAAPRALRAPTAQSGAPKLVVRGVSVRYGGVTAVDNVSFTVGGDRTDVFGIIGPNGAGKTSLFNAITGYASADAGSVEFNGARITGRRASAIAALGLRRTFQHNRLFHELSVRENVLVGTPSGLGRSERLRLVDDAIAFVGLSETALARSPGGLPYGQQKLVELARALAGVPSLVCLDEPAAGLNPEEKRHLAQLIADIAARGIDVVVIDHDVELISTTCGRVVCMDFGHVIASGVPQEVVTDDAVVAAYLGSRAPRRLAADVGRVVGEPRARM